MRNVLSTRFCDPVLQPARPGRRDRWPSAGTPGRCLVPAPRRIGWSVGNEERIGAGLGGNYGWSRNGSAGLRAYLSDQLDGRINISDETVMKWEAFLRLLEGCFQI